MAKAYPAEFRDDVVRVPRKHEATISQIAKDFGISEATLHNWLKRGPKCRDVKWSKVILSLCLA
jgi:transposase-like protein